MATKKAASTAAKKPASAKATTEEKPVGAKAAAPAPAKKAKAAEPKSGGKLGAETSPVATVSEKATEETAAAPKRSVTQQDIAVHAYHKWEKRGRQHGAHHEDWHEAERELHS